jgi:hypothetical protein
MEETIFYIAATYLALIALMTAHRLGRKVRAFSDPPIPLAEPYSLLVLTAAAIPFAVYLHDPELLPFALDPVTAAPAIAFVLSYLYGYLLTQISSRWIDHHDITDGSRQTIYEVKYFEDETGKTFLKEPKFFKRIFWIYDTMDLSAGIVLRERPIRVKHKEKWIEIEAVSVYGHDTFSEKIGKWARGKPRETAVLDAGGNVQYDAEGNVIKTLTRRYWFNFVRTHHVYLPAAICTESETDYLVNTTAYKAVAKKYGKMQVESARDKIKRELETIDSAAEIYVSLEDKDITEEMIKEFSDMVTPVLEEHERRRSHV